MTIKTIECAIVDRGWDEGWIVPQPPTHQTGKRVAVVGSGPAGLACAQQLARAGHAVTVFEKSDRIGGLLRYGIPDFKMEKHLIDRRIAQMEAEGVTFRTGAEVGADVSDRRAAGRVTTPWCWPAGRSGRAIWTCPGRELDGHPFRHGFPDPAEQARRRRRRGPRGARRHDLAPRASMCVVIGGGDTGSDCIGTSNRQGAASVTQLEILPKPPEQENKALIWPDWPTEAAHLAPRRRKAASATGRC